MGDYLLNRFGAGTQAVREISTLRNQRIDFVRRRAVRTTIS